MTTATYDHVPSQSGGGLASWIFSIDHKRVGIMYLVGALAAFVLAALMALGIRLEQYAPGESGLIQYFVGDFGKSMSTPDAYNSALTFHGAVMILGFVIPGLTGFATNYLVPILIGAKDVAFPRINSFSVWMYLMRCRFGAPVLHHPGQIGHDVDGLSALCGQDDGQHRDLLPHRANNGLLVDLGRHKLHHDHRLHARPRHGLESDEHVRLGQLFRQRPSAHLPSVSLDRGDIAVSRQICWDRLLRCG